MLLIAATSSLFAAPAADAHFEPSSLARPVPGVAALIASTKIELEQAPLEASGRCAQTKAISGLGNACATTGGLFRLKLRDGSSLTTHGFDGPQPDAFNTYLTGSSQAISTASANNIECVNAATTKHTTLIYAFPPGQASRYGTIAPLMRQEAYKMSAFLDAESRAVDPGKGIKIPLECDASSAPVVREVQTSTSTGSDSFGSIVSDLRSAGYGTTNSLVAKDRYIVFYDASLGSGYAGTGHLYQDDSASASSANNIGGMFADEFNWANTPHWDVMLHEAGHNMGAVQASAPHTSGSYVSGGNSYSAGHCYDGQDIMCYSDGGSNTYQPNVCAIEVFDCGRNDYFNPTPADGSYLATHWNTAGLYNQYLVHLNLNDITAPSTPTNLAQGAASDIATSVNWTASTDNVGVAGYHAWISNGQGGWALARSTTHTNSTIDSLSANSSYSVAVSAYDSAGNESARTTRTIYTNSMPDTTAPSQVGQLSTSSATMTSVKLMWAPAADDIGIAGYTVYRDYGGGNVGELATTEKEAFEVTGLQTANSYSFGVAAFDSAGHHSAPVWTSTATAADAMPPTTPGRPRVVNRARKSITLGWTPAADNIGVARYFVYRWNGSKWALAKVASGSARKVRVGGLRPNHRYHFILRATDTGGNYSSWSPQADAKTKR
ncbi:MAG: fibronectin type III domain-containing protein [Thermoleophilia bacterium]|nr:fibronectin type III domain-containing protein [Thermoleophilia bacterium]